MRLTRALAALVVIVAIAAWLAPARLIALNVDGVSTEQTVSSEIGRIAWNGSYLQIGSRMLGVEDPDNKLALSLDVDSLNRLVATA